jgi:leucyl aminopeptidase
MEFTTTNNHPEAQKTNCLVLGVFNNRELSPTATHLDSNSNANGFLSTILKSGDLDGKAGQTLFLYKVPTLLAERVLLVACGENKELEDNQYRDILRKTITALQPTGISDIVCTLTELPVKNRNIYWKTRQLIEIFMECTYLFNDFKSKPETKAHSLSKVIIPSLGSDEEKKSIEHAILEGIIIAEAVSKTRNLGNIPPNICTPSFLAKEAQALATRFPKIQTTVLDEKQIATLKMGALLAVGQGSQHPPKFITLEYAGHEQKNAKPIILVGKAVTFDTGGNSLKQPASMIGMKFDMCGGATVLATLEAAARLNLPLNIIGVIPTAENMPGSKAARPDDIVTTFSGQTVEILNTDAEGRLILCDALSYCERYQPEIVIDIATLTGACVMALGRFPSGLFSNHPPLTADLLQAGQESGDRCWELPLWEDYQEALASNFADMANISNVPEGGAITGACFLARFTKAYSWAHLDVAGTAFRTSGKEKGATGRPVPLLVQYLLNVTQKQQPEYKQG